MSKLGMWMPKQKDGKNWIVNYAGTRNGEPFAQSRKFRIRQDGYDFKENVMRLQSQDETKQFCVTSITVKKIM